jgi:hypothetical protein
MKSSLLAHPGKNRSLHGYRTDAILPLKTLSSSCRKSYPITLEDWIMSRGLLKVQCPQAILLED